MTVTLDNKCSHNKCRGRSLWHYVAAVLFYDQKEIKMYYPTFTSCEKHKMNNSMLIPDNLMPWLHKQFKLKFGEIAKVEIVVLPLVYHEYPIS